MSDQEEQQLAAAGGWCAPSSMAHVQPGEDIPELFIPNVRARRDGVKYGETHVLRPRREERVTYPTGHWEYGVDIADYDDGDTEPEIVSGDGSFYGEWDPFRSLTEAAEHHPGGKTYQRWVPAPGAWNEVKP